MRKQQTKKHGRPAPAKDPAHEERQQLSAETLRPMEAKLVSELPQDGAWQFEPKWDGFRCLAFRDGDAIDLRAKSGKPLTRYFPEIVAALSRLAAGHFIVDGELLILVENSLSFDALQMRLHPAQSRIDKLAHATPALLMLFDMIADRRGHSLLAQPLPARREALELFFAAISSHDRFRLSPITRDRKEAKVWLARAGQGALDGVIAKPLDRPYTPGERAMLKVKCLRTADCVVGGFRYASGSRDIGSLLLGLYNDEGRLDHVGFTSAIAQQDQAALKKKLAPLRGGAGFTGNAPGGPSRWSTERNSEWEPLKPVLVAEVRYDHVTGGRFRHGTAFLRWRPDKRPDQCKFEQLNTEGRPGRLVKQILG
ncbi:MAG TPA: ATP-dependent DNA ligase [Rhizomicrobium sp.]|jgi:ATP-dependent DNA ligase|nr:ATP-dependent DNA ligase [Rhizomicrobium sp.]